MKTLRTLALALLALAACGAEAHAQTAPDRLDGSVRLTGGAWLPVGDQADVFSEAFSLGLSGTWTAHPMVSIVGSAFWSPTELEPGVVASTLDRDADILQYDAGLELHLPRFRTQRKRVVPFVGAGLGGRSYLYSEDLIENSTVFSGYGAIGADVFLGAIAVRFEGRGHLLDFESPTGSEASDTGGDFRLSLGASYWF